MHIVCKQFIAEEIKKTKKQNWIYEWIKPSHLHPLLCFGMILYPVYLYVIEALGCTEFSYSRHVDMYFKKKQQKYKVL